MKYCNKKKTSCDVARFSRRWAGMCVLVDASLLLLRPSSTLSCRAASSCLTGYSTTCSTLACVHPIANAVHVCRILNPEGVLRASSCCHLVPTSSGGVHLPLEVIFRQTAFRSQTRLLWAWEVLYRKAQISFLGCINKSVIETINLSLNLTLANCSIDTGPLLLNQLLLLIQLLLRCDCLYSVNY